MTAGESTRLIWLANWVTVRRPIRVSFYHVGLAIRMIGDFEWDFNDLRKLRKINEL